MRAVNEPIPRPARPLGVYLVFGYYFFSAGLSLLSLGMIRQGKLAMPASQKAYFEGLTSLDFSLTVGLLLLTLTASFLLFLLRRSALWVFVAALVANVAVTALHAFTRNWFASVGVPGLVGAAFGWAILAGMIVYTKKLDRRGLLR